jgi:signal transduction histidine kinase
VAIVFGAGGVAGLALATLAGFLLAGRALVPIRQSLETQRRFVSDASHELRTPVAVMKANAELLLRHPDQTVDENIDQVAAINEEADHLTRLVGDLLTLARADEHRLEIVRERVNPVDVLEAPVRDLAAVAEAKGIALTSSLTPAQLDADPQRIRQLLVILIDNALKFTPAGGNISVTSSLQGSRWTLAVADTGTGIAPEDQPRIFDRFYRADQARVPQAGAGLGLAIARWIVEAHHGRISVASAPGQGATFTVSLPGAAAIPG